MGVVSWKTSLQSIAALSPTEAEYVVVTEGIKEATWLQGLMIELGVAQDTTVVFSHSQIATHLRKDDVIIPRPNTSVPSIILFEKLLLPEKLW